MSAIEREIDQRLKNIIDPRTGKTVLTGGFVQDVSLSPGEAGTSAIITCATPGGPSPANDELMAAIKSALLDLPEISKVTIVATAHREAQPQQTGGHANPLGVANKKPPSPRLEVPHLGQIIAVASGKGGVGKSTIAANLAISLARQGHRVGLMDADIYGPSVPVLFGLSEKPPAIDDKIGTIEKYGVHLMSIGLLLDESKALAWRGPMVMGAVQQLFTDVAWPELDVLIVDTPPGTGDAHLTLLQKLTLAGAVIVSTPQAMALADVRRGVQLFTKMEVPLLGLIENMSWLELPDGGQTPLFGQGGAKQAAAELGVPFLGELPMIPAIASGSDAGVPDIISHPDGAAAAYFDQLATQVSAAIALYPAAEEA